MNNLLDKPLSQIVNERHQTASVFEKYNLDYCCKGKVSLQEACKNNNVPVDTILKALEGIYSTKTKELDFSCLKLYQLTDYIVHTHHSYAKNETPLILSCLQKVSFKHGSSHNELSKILNLFVALSEAFTRQMNCEETILFPRIKALERNGFEPIPFTTEEHEFIKNLISSIVQEHIISEEIMNEIAHLTNNFTPPINCCTNFKLLYAKLKDFEIDLHHHLHLEHSILFPNALALEKALKLNALN